MLKDNYEIGNRLSIQYIEGLSENGFYFWGWILSFIFCEAWPKTFCMHAMKYHCWEEYVKRYR